MMLAREHNRNLAAPLCSDPNFALVLWTVNNRPAKLRQIPSVMLNSQKAL